MIPQADPPIDTVVFDLGNVLVGWDPYRVFAGRMSREEWEEFAEAADFPALNTMADAGAPYREVIDRAAERGPGYADIIRYYFEHYEDSLIGPIPGAADIVLEVKSAGLRVLGLTNWSSETYHFASKAAPVIDELEAVVVSGYEGMAKPDPRLFRKMAADHSLIPQRTVFIDDSERNVEAASDLGFVTVHFIGAAELRQDLRRILGLRRQ